MAETEILPATTVDTASGCHREPNSWNVAGQWFAIVSTLLYVLSRLLPYQMPDLEAVLDYSFPQVLHEGFARPLQFGRELIYTFGPWGFLATGYSPETHAVRVIVWTLLAVLFWQVGWRVAGQLTEHPLIRAFWMIIFTGIPGYSLDYFEWNVLFLFFHFFVARQPFTATHALMAMALALIGWIKFSVLVMTMAVMGVVVADTILRQRRFPWLAMVYGISFIASWLSAGQHFGTLGPYFLNSWRIANGYTEGMALSSKWEVQELVVFLIAAPLVSAQTVALAWAKDRHRGVFLLAGLAAILFLAFKHGFVRHDAHAESVPLGLFLVSMLNLAVGWQWLRNKPRWIVVVSLVPVLAVVWWAGLARARYMETNLISDFARTFRPVTLVEPIRLLAGSQHMRLELAKAYGGFRARYPITAIEGTADEYSFNQVAIFAHDLHYQPRPVIQSFTVYTPELAQLNASHLASDDAAENIFLDLISLDNRFPSLEDGLSWPEFLTRYDIQSIQPPFVWMKRSPTPRAWTLEPIAEVSVRFGQRLVMPTVASGPVWTKIEIDPTLRGRIISTLYKPPILSLDVMTRDGGQRSYRLVPGMAQAGFLLSPVIADIQAFGLLAIQGEQGQLAGREVVALAITAETASGTTALYRSPMRLRFFHLNFPKQKLGTKQQRG